MVAKGLYRGIGNMKDIFFQGKAPSRMESFTSPTQNHVYNVTGRSYSPY